MIARTVGGPSYLGTIEEMDEELSRVIEDFDRAVNVEALLLAKRVGKHSFSQWGQHSMLSRFVQSESEMRESGSEMRENERSECDWKSRARNGNAQSRNAQSKSFCLGGLSRSTLVITGTSAAWRALASSSSTR